MRQLLAAVAISLMAMVAVPGTAFALKKSTAVGAGAGAVAGAAVAGPVGAVVGGVAGGYAGSKYHRRSRGLRRHRR